MYVSTCRLPVAERRGYTSAFNALFRISREEGVLTLWRVSTGTPSTYCCMSIVIVELREQANTLHAYVGDQPAATLVYSSFESTNQIHYEVPMSDQLASLSLPLPPPPAGLWSHHGQGYGSECCTTGHLLTGQTATSWTW